MSMTNALFPPGMPWYLRVLSWFDADTDAKDGLLKRSEEAKLSVRPAKKTDWIRLSPFAFLHVGCIGLFWVGLSPFAVGFAVALYFIRMFFVTGFYHRYFSHRTFQTNRFWQFVFAVAGLTAIQRGPLWWAANHRHHHRHSDDAADLHSPVQDTFWWSHIGWMTDKANLYTDYKLIPDLAKFPELVFLNRFDWVVPMCFGITLLILGEVLRVTMPGLHTTGPQVLVWGFFVSTVVLFHMTCTINSLSHVWGGRRYQTTDDSRNNFWLAMATLGEGWHNNHHHYQGSVRQGFYWWEIDVTFYTLKVLSWLKIVRQLHPVPANAYDSANHIKKTT